MSFVENKSRSLLELKRLQWAKEREEMANMCAPWGTQRKYYNNAAIRPSYASVDGTIYTRHSLPPISKSEYAIHHPESYDHGGETSGYASDCAPQQQPDIWSGIKPRRSISQSQNMWALGRGDGQNSPDSVSTAGRAEERLRWGDRGVGVGHLWEPHEVDERPQLKGDGSPPGWLQRGLRGDTEMLVISHGSEKEGSEDTESSGQRTYLRGQNIPIDASILAERELKRQRALELQSAIRQQLEERDRLRKEEREKKLREERKEEERIKREQELEQERLHAEERHALEKIEWEKKRSEVMRQAIEEAERQAKLEKLRLKKERLRLNSSSGYEETNSLQNVGDTNRHKIAEEKNNKVPSEYSVPTSQTSELPLKNPSPPPTKTHTQIAQVQPSTRILTQTVPTTAPEVHPHIVPPQICAPELPKQPEIMPTADGLALVLQPTAFDTTLSNLQFALLMSPHVSLASSTPMPIALTSRTDRAMLTDNLPVSYRLPQQEYLTSNRVLTPTKYRTRSNLRDSSTQTEKVDTPEVIQQKEYKYGSLDRQQHRNSRSRKEKRMHSEERTLEERPKWGVNRPPTQYLTQSEKDPLYQKRKLRQKMRELKLFGDKINNYSSDESRSPSPVTTRSFNHKNLMRNQWQRNEKMYMRNVNVYQTEIVPLESDSKGRIYVGQKNTTKRQSISEKFLVAKQRNEMNRIDRCYDSDRNDLFIESRKSKLNKQNERRKIQSDNDPLNLDDYEENEVINQLSNLKQQLMMKQWEMKSKKSVSPKPPDVDIDVF